MRFDLSKLKSIVLSLGVIAFAPRSNSLMIQSWDEAISKLSAKPYLFGAFFKLTQELD